MQLISLGIVLYQNAREEIFKCLDAIAYQDYPLNQIEVLIRDQGGQSNQWVKEWILLFPNKLNIHISEGDNLGFGAGHNMLFETRSIQSKAYICLNPDALLHPACITNLCRFAQHHKWHGLFEGMQEPVMQPKFYDRTTGETEWSCGACLLIPVDIFAKLQGFDPNFFMYCEDVDLSWRARAQNIPCYLCEDALFYHYVGDRSDRMEMVFYSQYLLALKWGSPQNQLESANRLLAINPEKAPMQMKNVESILPMSFEDILRVQPKFDQGDVYAERLWI